jgi:hypothetical protein
MGIFRSVSARSIDLRYAAPNERQFYTNQKTTQTCVVPLLFMVGHVGIEPTTF